MDHLNFQFLLQWQLEQLQSLGRKSTFYLGCNGGIVQIEKAHVYKRIPEICQETWLGQRGQRLRKV